MRIRRDGRIEPFSHTPGICMPIPGTCQTARLFPTRVEIGDWIWTLPAQAPIEEFTAQLDLERGCVRVWSRTFRFDLSAGPYIKLERGDLPLPEGLVHERFTAPECPERLSLGCHKSQEWDLMVRRCDMAEIFPAWLRLGQMLPEQAKGPFVDSLLEQCASGRELAPFVDLFRAGFSGLFCPRLFDESYHGFSSAPLGSFKESAWPILSAGAVQIRSLFLSESEEILSLLPRLPNPFHAGRFLDVRWRLGRLDMEWSKGRLRRLIVRGEQGGSFLLETGQWKRCRLGNRLLQRGDLVTLAKDETLYFDRFEK